MALGSTVAAVLEGLWIATLVITVANLGVTAWLFALSRGARRRRHARPTPSRRPDDGDTLFVFVVPACDEAAVIADSVARLDAVQGVDRWILVVDDGSTDGTGAVLDDLARGRDDLVVLHRVAPEARMGKGAALNAAWREIHARLDGRDPDQVIVGVVDADGRLDADAPASVARHFEDPGVGGVQITVRMYNRDANLLARMQDVEFVAFGELYQQARNRLDTVGLGGNGQFTRLSALDAVAGPDGPWRDVLTEDMDLGIRMHLSEWRCVWDGDVAVEQQALTSVRRLVRQRSRWFQGVVQSWQWCTGILRAPRMSRPAKFDLLWWLAAPVFIAVVAVTTAIFILNLVNLALFHLDLVPRWFADHPWWYLLLVYGFAFGVQFLALWTYWADDRRRGFARSFVYAHAMALYAWVWLVAGIWALGRQLRGRTGWKKTAREPIGVPTAGEVAGPIAERAGAAKTERRSA